MSRFPACTVLLTSVCLSVSAIAGLSGFLVFSRADVVSGELWRLLTCHLVHFSNEHLLLDVVVFSILAGTIELRAGSLKLLFLVLGIAMAIGLLLLFIRPQMARYGGLSGINYGLLMVIALHGVSAGKTRAISLLVLAGALVNITMQGLGGQSWVRYGSANELIVIWEAHLMGCLAAAILYGVLKVWVPPDPVIILTRRRAGFFHPNAQS